MLAVQLRRCPVRHGGLPPPPGARVVAEIGRVEELALKLPSDPVNDAIAELGAIGERLGRLLQEGGVGGWRKWASGGEEDFDVAIAEV